MIRIKIGGKGGGLKRRVLAQVPDWENRATRRVQHFEQLNKFDESAFLKDESGFWTELKPLFVEIQSSKCAYCERSIDKLEHDLEHYRPKSVVHPWPSQRYHSARFPFPTGTRLKNGYYLLSYDHQNFLTACASCNRFIKGSYFPIAGARVEGTKNLADYHVEQPFIPFPLGSRDQNPEDLIDFHGIFAKARKSKGHARRRALVTIEFFKLNTREYLLWERAEAIRDLWLTLSFGTKDSARILESQLSKRSSHLNCKRSFVRCFQNNPDEAYSLFKKALDYLETES